MLVQSGKEDLEGKLAIYKSASAVYSKMKITDVGIKTGETNICGDRIYQHGSYHESFVEKGEKPGSADGRYFSIWDRQEDGSWKISRLFVIVTPSR